MFVSGTRISFQSLLSRADDVVLQELVGLNVVRLLRSIDPALATPTSLRNLLSDFKEPVDLLRDSDTRGILLDLLPTGTAEQLRETLNLPTAGDPFNALKSFNPHRRSQLEERLFSFFGLEVPQEAAQDPVAKSEEVRGKYQLFDHQRRAVLKVRQMLASQRPRVLLHMPTGSGKTRTAMNVIAEHLRSNEPALVIWLAFSDELCEQAVEEFQKAWRYLGQPAESTLYRFWGASDPDLQAVRDGFVVAGLGQNVQLCIEEDSPSLQP